MDAKFECNTSILDVDFSNTSSNLPCDVQSNNQMMDCEFGNLSFASGGGCECPDNWDEIITEAVESALTEAKESGEFNGKDGKDGKDGYTPVKGIDYFDGKDGKDGLDGQNGKDGYTPVKGVDYFDGINGKDGADGYTPIKGVDYWNEADKAEITKAAEDTVKEETPAILQSANEYTDRQIAAIPTPDVSGQINAHNTATDTHNDIRLLIAGLSERLNALANSDDTTLDQMAEVVDYIKANRDLIEQVTNTKVNVLDIIDNLTTNVSNKPLSAAQGVALKALIDAIKIPTKISAFENDKGYLTEHQDLSGYAKTTEIPTKTSELTNDSGFLTTDTVGKMYKGAWIATECTGISQKYTETITLPAGTYVVNVVAPYCSDFTARVCISFSAKMAIGSGATFIYAAYGAVTMLTTFTTTTNLTVLSGASANKATWSYLDRGGIAAVRIA